MYGRKAGNAREDFCGPDVPGDAPVHLGNTRAEAKAEKPIHLWYGMSAGARKIRVGRYPPDDQNPGCEADCLVPGQRLRQAKCNALPFRAFIRATIAFAPSIGQVDI